MFDYHVHSSNSVDCAIPMIRSCEAAISAGVTEIAFTDHIDHEPADPGVGHWNGEKYFRELAEAKQQFGDRLTILAGAEVDFNRRIQPQVEHFLGQYEFDFVIGSVHYAKIGDDLPGEIIFPEYFVGKSLDDVFLPYFEEIQAAIETGWFDTIGHLDLPKRYAPATHRTYNPSRYQEALQPIFSALIANKVAFEINTSGLRQGPKASMPGPAIVRWYVDAGGQRITTGTDSHAWQTVGAGLSTTLDMLALCGISSVLSFRQRRGTPVTVDTLRPVART